MSAASPPQQPIKGAAALSISLAASLRKAHPSAFHAFQHPSTSAIASTTCSTAASPSLKNALQPSSGTFLNELQKLQLDIGSELSSAPSSNQSSAGLDPDSSTSPAVDALKLTNLKVSANAAGQESNDEESLDETSDRAHKPLHRCTLDALDLFRTCNPAYSWTGAFQPRRVLTSPSIPSLTNPNDNANNNLIMSVGDVLWHNTEDSHVSLKVKQQPASGTGVGSKPAVKLVKSFKVMELLGEGTFGQVVKCEEVISAAGPSLAHPPAPAKHTPAKSKVYRAIKVIKNKPAYYNQALMEIQILKQLNEKYDPKNEHHLLRMVESFNCKGHLCLVFELLSVNLYDLMKQNGYRGLSWSLLRIFLKQILDALSVLTKAKIIHCDLKPENILLNKLTAPDITLIDFGSACFENQTVYSYIQSRFYRSPEVLISLPYNSHIDLWSFGCIAAELYLGLPLFPGITQQNQLYRIIKFIGPPPASMLQKGKNTKKFFKIETIAPSPAALAANPAAPTTTQYTLKTAEEYAADTHTDVAVHKTYFKGSNLKEVVDMYPMRKGLTDAQKAQELEDRKCFLHFLQGFLRWDSKTRWLPKQALQHPFLQRQPLSTLNEHAFEQLRHTIDQPASIPPVMPPAGASTPTSTTAPAAAATVATPSASSGTASNASSPKASAFTAAITTPSKSAQNPAAGAVAALLTNQELAQRQLQQQQQQQHYQQQPQQYQQQPAHQSTLPATMQQQPPQPGAFFAQPAQSGAAAATAGFNLTSQSTILATALMQQQLQQQQLYGTSPQSRASFSGGGAFQPQSPSQQQRGIGIQPAFATQQPYAYQTQPSGATAGSYQQPYQAHHPGQQTFVAGAPASAGFHVAAQPIQTRAHEPPLPK